MDNKNMVNKMDNKDEFIPRGIVLNPEDAEKVGIEIEDKTVSVSNHSGNVMKSKVVMRVNVKK